MIQFKSRLIYGKETNLKEKIEKLPISFETKILKLR